MESIKFTKSEWEEINRLVTMLSSSDMEMRSLAVSMAENSPLNTKLCGLYRLTKQKKITSFLGIISFSKKLREEKDPHWFVPLLTFLKDLIEERGFLFFSCVMIDHES